MPTRQLKINGNKISNLVTAEILVNGTQVYTGELGSDLTPVSFSSQPGLSGDLVTVDYEGSVNQETIAVEIKVTEGTVLLGPMFTDLTDLNTNQLSWLNIAGENIDLGDGRTNILVDGVAPEWPSDPAIVSPGGDPAHPAWTGYCFLVTSGSELTCDFAACDAVIPLVDDEPPL